MSRQQQIHGDAYRNLRDNLVLKGSVNVLHFSLHPVTCHVTSHSFLRGLRARAEDFGSSPYQRLLPIERDFSVSSQSLSSFLLSQVGQHLQHDELHPSPCG
jgi:hypothetical protein